MNSKEFIKSLDTIVEEKGIDKEYVLDALSTALQTAYKKNFNSKTNVKVDINPDTGKIKVYTYYVVVDDLDFGKDVEKDDGTVEHIDPEINLDAQLILEEAVKIDPNIKVGETIQEEVTPSDFGRVAALIAKQVVMQKIREAEKNSIIEEFSSKQDEMILGNLGMEDSKNYYVDLGRTRGILPKSEMIPGENVKMGTSIKAYVTKVESTPKGPLILLSRKHYGFVKRLFEAEIPEINDGSIIIYSVARDAGNRSKVAVYSTKSQIDPIGSCIGAKGIRIANILKELNGEKIDLVLYNEDPVEFIKNAMSPAKDVIVSIKDEIKKEALVIVNDDNLALAIGKKGSNIKLASRLTKYKLEVKTMAQIQEEGNK